MVEIPSRRAVLRRPSFGRALAALAALPFAACSEPPPPTVVLVTLDTTRAQNLSTYGYTRPTDPFLRSLSERSRVFERAYSTTTWTLPSHVSMFTGLPPAEHGVWFRLEQTDGGSSFPVVGAQQPLVTERLVEAGYTLLGAGGGPFTRSLYGLARDFDWFTEPEGGLGQPAGGSWQLTGAEINRRLFPELRALDGDRPLFLFVNYFDAHAPYDPPQDRSYPFPLPGELSFLQGSRTLHPMPDMTEWVAQGQAIPPEFIALAVANYDQELLLQDEALAALWAELERLGRLRDALVIVTADHGEMFGEQPDRFGHSDRPWEPATRVPLVVYRTGGPVDRIDGPVSVQQVAVTITEALGLAPLPAPVGGALPSLLAEDPRPGEAFAEMHTPDTWVAALHRGREKWLVDWVVERRELPEPTGVWLDLSLNPAEDLGGREPLEMFPPLSPAAERGWRRLAELRGRWEQAPDRSGRASLSPEELRGLAQMGYLELPVGDGAAGK
jgi:arylsulfatase A-like enzyme